MSRSLVWRFLAVCEAHELTTIFQTDLLQKITDMALRRTR
jgi:hypothetical protein